MRDLYDIDLMGMYNCFSYELFSDIYIGFDEKQKRNRIFVGNNKEKKVLAIPIRFNQIYTIAVNSNKPVYVSPVLKLPNGLRSLSQLKISSYTESTMGVRLLDSMQFNQPKQISIDLTEDQGEFYKYERYLYLVVQLDASNSSSFVMLEGEYGDYDEIPIVGMSKEEYAYED